MRILHISALPIWPLGGKGGMPSLAETLRGHQRGGHEISIILPRYDLFDDEKIAIQTPADVTYKVHFAFCWWLPGVKMLRRGIRKIVRSQELPFAIRWILNMTMFLCLTVSMVIAALRVRAGETKKFDLVYAHNQYTSLAGLVLRMIFRVPNVTRLYGTFLGDLMNRPFVRLRYPVAAAGFWVPSRLLICCNDGTRGDEVARRLKVKPERFRFWQNGIDPPKEAPRVTREEFIHSHGSPALRRESVWVCSCSRLSYWKRIDRMLEAIRFCRESGQDCQLLLAGDGPERAKLEEMAKTLGIEADVVWFGAIAHEEIWVLMNLCDVFMITNDVTNRCNPLYEAMYAGLPVASVRDPSTRDLLVHEENALLAERGKPEELGKHLLRLCQSGELRDSMRRSQKSRAQSFWSWEERMACEVGELEKLVKPVQRNREIPGISCRMAEKDKKVMEKEL